MLRRRQCAVQETVIRGLKTPLMLAAGQRVASSRADDFATRARRYDLIVSMLYAEPVGRVSDNKFIKRRGELNS